MEEIHKARAERLVKKLFELQRDIDNKEAVLLDLDERAYERYIEAIREHSY